jgi:hypothetical protein
MKQFMKVFGLSLLLLALATMAFGQAVSGDLVGTVSDTSGAVVANAKVDVLNLGTGLKQTANTSNQGAYHLVNLPSGHYSVTATSAGLKGGIKDVEVVINKATTANIAINIAADSTTVEVSAATSTIDTQTPNIQTTFEAKELNDLSAASTGSGVLNLALYDAGVASAGGLGAGSGPSVSGQRPQNNNFTIEGVDNNAKSTTGALTQIPNDAVEEFTVLQNQFSPEFGHSSGGQFNQTIKGGTNEFHGKAYEYFQNRNLNAQDKLAAGQPMARYDNNRFGGQVGGPVIKNKVFFFANYEYNPVGLASGAPATYVVPTAAGIAQLAGLYSGSNLAQFQKYVPVAPVATPKDATAICAVAANAAGCPGNNYVSAGDLSFVGSAYQNNTTSTNSLDFNLSSKDQLRLRYIYEKQNQSDTTASIPAFWGVLPYRYHIFTLGEYHNFSSSVTNEFRLGFNRYYNITGAGPASFPGLASFPNITLDDTAGLNIGPNPNAPQETIQNVYQVTNNLSWVKGKHTFRFGGEYREYISPQTFTQRVRGDYDWSQLALYLQDAVPDTAGQRSMGDSVYYGNQQAVYLYGNDEFRVTPSLTLNVGLRWEVTTVPLSQSKDQPLNAIANVPGLINFSSPKKQMNNFAPRLGFAYSPSFLPNTSIRGGVSIAYDVLYDNLGILSLPPELQQTCDVANTPNAQCYWNSTAFLANGGLPSITPAPPTSAADARSNSSAYIPDQKLPYTETWNIGFQHIFAKNYTFEARYVGTRGIDLPVQTRLNISSPVTATQNLPTFLSQSSALAYAGGSTSQLNLQTLQALGHYQTAYGAAGFNSAALVGFMPYGGSKYNGLQVQLGRSYSNGLQYKIAWTWSHAFDNSTADVNSTSLTPRRAQDFQNYGAEWGTSLLDRRHRVTAEVIYNVPFFKSSNNWFAKNLAGNWQFAPAYVFESPEYATVQSNVDSNLNGDSATDRAILNPGGMAGTGSGSTPVCNSNMPTTATCGQTSADPTKDSYPYLVGYYANNPKAKYITAGLGSYANAPRNTLAMARINNWDLSAVKRISVTERQAFEFQVHAYNAFNHPQSTPGKLNDITYVDTSSSAVRQVVIPDSPSGFFNQPSKVFSSNPRTLQLVMKYIF